MKNHTRKIKKLKHHGSGKVLPSKYYSIRRTTYSHDENTTPEFNLYSKEKLMEMLTDVELQHLIPEVKEWFKAFQTTVKAEINNMFETMFETNIQNTLIIKNLWNKINNVVESEEEVLSLFINYQVTDDDARKQITELVRQFYAIVSDPDADTMDKYTSFKQFVTTMLDEKLFSINILNFIKNMVAYSKINSYKYNFSVRPPQRIDIQLTPEQHDFNEFVVKYDTYIENTINPLIVSHYDKIIEIFTNIGAKYDEEIAVPIINAAIAQSNNEYTLVLKKGTRLYKGVNSASKSRLKFSSEQDKLLSWFAFVPFTTFSYGLTQNKPPSTINMLCTPATPENEATAKNLGYIGEFTVNADYELLNLLHPNIIQYLTNLADGDADVIDNINKILYVENGKIGRKSEYEADVKFVKWLCSKGYNGYIAKETAIKLHPELCLCNPETKLDPLTEDDITSMADLFFFCDGKYSDINFKLSLSTAF
jgi:hypothetical protein